jgi:hypothetical protein
VENNLGHARAEEFHMLLVERKVYMFIQLFDQYTSFSSFRGIEPSSSAVDIKKAYHKAALRHHPDKVLYSFSIFCFLHSYLV